MNITILVCFSGYIWLWLLYNGAGSLHCSKAHYWVTTILCKCTQILVKPHLFDFFLKKGIVQNVPMKRSISFQSPIFCIHEIPTNQITYFLIAQIIFINFFIFWLLSMCILNFNVFLTPFCWVRRVFIQLLCSYSTLPLYAIVTQVS